MKSSQSEFRLLKKSEGLYCLYGLVLYLFSLKAIKSEKLSVSFGLIFPSPSELASLLDVKKLSINRLYDLLIAEKIISIMGRGKATCYMLRSQERLIKYLFSSYKKTAGENYYIPFLLPRSIGSKKKLEKIEYIFSNLDKEDRLDSILYSLHSSTLLSNEQDQIFRSEDIEIMIDPDQASRILELIPGSPLIMEKERSRQKKATLHGDIIFYYNRLSSQIIDRFNKLEIVDGLKNEVVNEYEERRLLSPLLNALELNDYPRRGIEASQHIMMQYRNAREQ